MGASNKGQLRAVSFLTNSPSKQTIKQWDGEYTKFPIGGMMIFRILKAPPGFPPEEQFRVVEYENADLDSRIIQWRSVASLEEARQTIPIDAVRLPFEPMNQFLELYSQNKSNQP